MYMISVKAVILQRLLLYEQKTLTFHYGVVDLEHNNHCLLR